MKTFLKNNLFTLFSSLGISICLLMIIGVLAIICFNGTKTFWPKDIVEIQLKSGEKFAGIFVEERKGSKQYIKKLELVEANFVKSLAENKNSEILKKKLKLVKEKIAYFKNLEEFKYFLANREEQGFSFKWFQKDEIKSVSSNNKDYILIAKEQSSQLIVQPIRIKTPNEEIFSSDKNFHKKLSDIYNQQKKLKKEFNLINTRERYHINRKLKRLKLEIFKSKKYKDNNKDILDEYNQTRNKLLELEGKTEKLKKKLYLNFLEVKFSSGKTKNIAISSIVRYDLPNRHSLFGRLKQFIKNIFYFLFADPYEANTQGGVFPAIIGTLVMTVLMTFLLTPFGVIAAIYLREYAKDTKFVRFVRICINNLAGVPSIVFGAFGLGFFVYVLGSSIDQWFYSDYLEAFKEPVFGTGGLLWASLTLSLMNLPVVIVATEEALNSIPQSTRNASLACGATHWQTVKGILIPVSAPGIVTGMILAMSRGAGEVAPLMLVGVVKFSSSLPIDLSFPFINFSNKFMHLGFHIYDLGFQSPDSEAARPMVFATTFLLIFIVLLLNSIGIIIRHKLRKKYSSAQF